MPTRGAIAVLACVVCGAHAIATPINRAKVAHSIDVASRRCLTDPYNQRGFKDLRSFGASRELPVREALSTAQLEALTGLPRKAFMPAMQEQPSRLRAPSDARLADNRAAFVEPSAQLFELTAAASLLLGASCLGLQESAADALRAIEDTQLKSAWLPVTCGVVSGSALALLLVDALRRGGSLTRSLRSADRREAVLRHEAGHFLACILLGVPVAAVHIEEIGRAHV